MVDEISAIGSTTQGAPPLETQPMESVVEQRLFDYIAEVEKSGAGQLSDPAAMVRGALDSLGGTITEIQQTFDRAKAKSAEGPPPIDVETSSAETRGPGTAGDATRQNAESPEVLLERSMSVMWAAANLEVVVSSVTAATSSASTLTKQQ